MNKVKVLYIVGWGRSGSTILDNLIGQLPGFFSAGELRYFCRRGLVENRICGNGIRFQEHPIWKEVASMSTDGLERRSSNQLARLERNILQPWLCAPQLLLRGKITQSAESQDYVELLSRIYEAVQKAGDCQYIVDSSKNPVYAYFLSKVPSIDLHLIHLVRDPRAVSYSWYRKKHQPDLGQNAQTVQHGAIKSALQWVIVNNLSERVAHDSGDSTFIRYEDFAENPIGITDRILQKLPGVKSHVPIRDGNRIDLCTNHAFSGNPSRFKAGETIITPDISWQLELPTNRRVLTEALCGSTMRRYGY